MTQAIVATSAPLLGAETIRVDLGVAGCGCLITEEIRTVNSTSVLGTERTEHRDNCWDVRVGKANEPSAKQVAHAVAALSAQRNPHTYLGAYLAACIEAMARGERTDGDLQDAMAYIRAYAQLTGGVR